MPKKKIEQKSGKDSINNQNNDFSTNTSVVYVQNGLTYDEARQIAIDVFKSETKKYEGEALKIVNKKAQELIDEFLEKVYDSNYKDTYRFKEPAIQHAIYNAQKGFCLDETGETKQDYIQMLIARINCSQKSVLQISIDESINTVEKLTSEQMDCLTVMFLLLYPQYKLNNIYNLNMYFNEICSFYHESFNLPSTPLSLKVYKTCLSFDSVKNYIPIEEIMKDNFPGLFFKGFNEKELVSISNHESSYYNKILIKDIRDSNKIQINALDVDTLKSNIKGTPLEEEESQLIDFFNNHIMSLNEIEKILKTIDPNMERLMNTWKNSDLKYCQLTPIGTIIAISNYNKKMNKQLDFSRFII